MTGETGVSIEFNVDGALLGVMILFYDLFPSFLSMGISRDRLPTYIDHPPLYNSPTTTKWGLIRSKERSEIKGGGGGYTGRALTFSRAVMDITGPNVP